MNRQAVRIVDFRAVIIAGGALVFTEEVHTGQRRQPELGHVLAKKQPRFHLNDRLGAGLELQTVRAAHAARIEQRVDRERAGVGRRTLDPEFDEAGKLLAGREAGIDRNPARRQTI